jgi:hypothetical protein
MQKLAKRISPKHRIIYEKYPFLKQYSMMELSSACRRTFKHTHILDLTLEEVNIIVYESQHVPEDILEERRKNNIHSAKMAFIRKERRKKAGSEIQLAQKIADKKARDGEEKRKEDEKHDRIKRELELEIYQQTKEEDTLKGLVTKMSRCSWHFSMEKYRERKKSELWLYLLEREKNALRARNLRKTKMALRRSSETGVQQPSQVNRGIRKGLET